MDILEMEDNPHWCQVWGPGKSHKGYFYGGDFFISFCGRTLMNKDYSEMQSFEALYGDDETQWPMNNCCKRCLNKCGYYIPLVS